MTQLASIKCAAPIKIGKKPAETFFTHEKYNIEMHPNCTIVVQCKQTGEVARTSLFNVPYWVDMDDLPRQGAARTKKAGQSLEVQ